MTERWEQLPAADSELWALVEAIVEETATAEERDRLEARLRAEPQARLFYVAYLDLHAHLQWTTRGESAQSIGTSQPALEGQRVPSEAVPGSFRTRRSWWRARALFGSPYRGAIAASLVLAAGLLTALQLLRHAPEEGEPPDLPDAPPGSVAVLIDDRNTVWDKDMILPTETGSALSPGRLKLKSGVVEIAFHGGGEVLLEGPADFDVSAPDQAFLHQGKLIAQVPEGAPAFRIGMPGVVVTDLGGECGLLRNDESGLSEIHVFEGQVGADATDRAGEPEQGMRLAEKAGARVDASRRTITPVPLNEHVFARLRPEIRVSDATVRGGQYAGRNFGTAPRLVVKNSIADYTWDTYLRFDLSGLKGEVREAVVRLVPVRVGQPLLNAAALVPDNRWGETTLTWNNKPSCGPPFAHWMVEEGQAVEFDVTRFVQAALAGDKKLSLRIFAPQRKRGSSFVQYGSRRSDAESRPQLLVTTEP
jgi:hypothetical protein